MSLNIIYWTLFSLCGSYKYPAYLCRSIHGIYRYIYIYIYIYIYWVFTCWNHSVWLSFILTLSQIFRLFSFVDAVENWAVLHGLSKATTKALLNHGFDSFEAFIHATDDDLKSIPGINVAQRGFLRNAIKKLQEGGPGKI